MKLKRGDLFECVADNNSSWPIIDRKDANKPIYFLYLKKHSVMIYNHKSISSTIVFNYNTDWLSNNITLNVIFKLVKRGVPSELADFINMGNLLSL